jgi:hypothetical protein
MKKFVRESWNYVLKCLSTSTLSLVLFSVVFPILVFVVTAAISYWAHQRSIPLTQILKDALVPTLIVIAVPAAGLLVLLVSGFVNTIRAMQSRITQRDHEIENLQTVKPKTTMNRDWPSDWRLAEQDFRRYQVSSVMGTWQRSAYGSTESWRVHGDQPNIVREVEAFCKNCGKLLLYSPLSEPLSRDIVSVTDDRDRWLYFLKQRYPLKEVQTGSETVGGKTYAVTIGSIYILAAVSASACVECSALAFTT